MILFFLYFEFLNDDLDLLILAFVYDLFVQCGNLRVETVFYPLNVQLCTNSFTLNLLDVNLLSSSFQLLIFLCYFLFVRVDFHHVFQLTLVDVY